MVQGNWERRAEMSEARRLEAKQRKQRIVERKVFKVQTQDLMSFLNTNADQLFDQRDSTGRRKDPIIHIWTDTPPRSEDGSTLHHHLWEEEYIKKKKSGKNDSDRRSTSFDYDKDLRSAKYNRNTGQRKKKYHPRSKESPHSNSNSVDYNQNETIETPKLSRSHFFFGKCCNSTQKNRGSGGKKSHGCRFAHYPKSYLTMMDVLLPSGFCDNDQDISTSLAKANLCSSEKAYPISFMVGNKLPDADAMDMVFYSFICTSELYEGNSDQKQPSFSTISNFIVNKMAKKSCNLGSIVFFAVGNQLLYDRYRKGIVVKENQLTKIGQNSTSMNRNRTADFSVESMSLSASILEHILLFLDDSAVSTMSSVSRSWHQEIGKQSGHLWRHLLQRRSWPIPSCKEQGQAVLSILRESFISHYTAVRDVDGIKRGIECLLYRKPMKEFDGSVRSFESSRISSQDNNTCVAVKIWAANTFLAAYRQDCSLRLFDSVEGSEKSGERLCRELVFHSADPYKNTKKRNCQLVTVALDTDFVGCLLHMVDEISEEETFLLTVTSRETFLINDQLDRNDMQVIDIRECILNFLLSCDDVDHRLLQLHDFIANDGSLDDVDVFVSPSLVECGQGRFVVEVAIAIPSSDILDQHATHDSILFRKFFLFSTSVGAITWMSDSAQPMTLLRSPNEEMTLSSSKITENGQCLYKIVSLSCASPTITSISVDHNGYLFNSTFIEGTDSVRNEIETDLWSIRRSRKRPVLMVDGEVAVADNLVCEENGKKRSVVNFFPLDNKRRCSKLNRLDLLGNLEVCHLVALRTAHLVAVCRVFESPTETDDVDDIAGHWFGPDTSSVVSVYAIVIDIESRSEIFRTCIVNNLGLRFGEDSVDLFSNDEELPIQLAIQGGTVVAGISSKGIILTGADSRTHRVSISLSRQELATPSKSAKKVKKKKLSKKSGKKDGFARGQKM
mmetsp:Transcript_13808/g.32225  ORF Transcript_13808/g.32225 Transcript_13808/m.32225 type:complete len:956 (-) Transcript_13808:20-2887(-)